MNLPAEDIKHVFPVVYRNDGIFILKSGEPICWWIRKHSYPLELGTVKGNKKVNNFIELIKQIVYLEQNIKITDFEAFSGYIMITQIAKWAAIKIPSKEERTVEQSEFNFKNKNWTGMPRVIVHRELPNCLIEDITVDEQGYSRSDTVVKKDGVEVCRFTTQTAFPFILNIQNECREVKTPEDFVKILEKFK